jgi:hypothetical protein
VKKVSEEIGHAQNSRWNQILVMDLPLKIKGTIFQEEFLASNAIRGQWVST